MKLNGWCNVCLKPFAECECHKMRISMKQIKDVEKLKELIAKKDFVFSDTGNVVENIILSIIDSLAVEVPEAKPGVIDKALKGYENALSYTPHGGYRELGKDRIRAARAELAQLQAEREEANSIIRSWINGDVEEGKSLEQKAREYLRKVGI